MKFVATQVGPNRVEVKEAKTYHETDGLPRLSISGNLEKRVKGVRLLLDSFTSRKQKISVTVADYGSLVAAVQRINKKRTDTSQVSLRLAA